MLDDLSAQQVLLALGVGIGFIVLYVAGLIPRHSWRAPSPTPEAVSAEDRELMRRLISALEGNTAAHARTEAATDKLRGALHELSEQMRIERELRRRS